jgi:hypothetical protein
MRLGERMVFVKILGKHHVIIYFNKLKTILKILKYTSKQLTNNLKDLDCTILNLAHKKNIQDRITFMNDYHIIRIIISL